jgi:hypothetical protein
VEERPTIYESAARRRSRRLRTVLVIAAAAVLLGGALATAAVWTLGGESREGVTSAAVSPAPSPAQPSRQSQPLDLRLARLADMEVHRGEVAELRYRLVEGPSGTKVTLVLSDAAGGRIKARRLADAEAGEWVSARVPIDLEPGRYIYTLHLGVPAESAAGTTGATDTGVAASGPSGSPDSAAAELRVLAPLPPGFPGKMAVAAAEEWIGGRDGEVAFAVVDTKGNDAGGYREHEPFQLASLAKAILLVASLRADPTPDATTRASLTSMITESDNGAASAVFGRAGAEGMKAVARSAAMQDYQQGAGWVDTRASAFDEARFFSRLESLVPAEGRSLARSLLSGVTPLQRWGIPAAAGPEGWSSYFKGGWLGTDNKLMVQAAWLERGEKKWALAVMSDENPTRSSGWDTQKGVTALLLGQEPTPSYLAQVLE